MGLEARTTFDLMQMAGAGCGFVLTATVRTTVDLMQIAGAAHRGGARVTFTGLANRTTADLMQIGAAGKGSVVIEA